VTLTPKVSDGTITDDQLKQAVDIIRQRVNGLGVSEAEVSTQGQGNSAAILVSVPGVSEQGIADVLKQTAKLAFRPVEELAAGTPASTTTATPSGSASATASATPSASASAADKVYAPFESDSNDAALQAAFANIDCTDPAVRQGGVPDDPTKWVVTCSKDGFSKYLLQPAFIEGTSIDNASAGVPQGGTTWLVTLDFDSEGTQKLADASTLLYKQTSPKNQFAIVLDGLVSSLSQSLVVRLRSLARSHSKKQLTLRTS
jgi:preprotein translocase subunit SecD